MTEKTWTLTLNKYQRDNLLWLINACGWPGANGVAPFTMANNGDWIGEIGWMLQNENETPRIGEGDHPNMSLDELFDRVEDWRDD